jgi:glucose-1-phosphate adenylyltransferase
MHEVKTSTKIQEQESDRLSPLPAVDMSRVASIILGGGQGTRLFPLTHTRCKPATPFGGRYRLIDVPISNSINSGINKIFVVTQFLSYRLHQHIIKTYRFDTYSSGFIDLLAAEQKPSGSLWFQGTADAVRQNTEYFCETPADYFLILSGDQLYNLDFQKMLRFAQESDAELVVGTLPVAEEEARRMGIMKVDASSRISDFCEKPTDRVQLEKMRSPELLKSNPENPYLASMGIYLFRRDALFNLLKQDVREDFGKHLIPTMVETCKAWSYQYDGYWEDIGTVESYYNANLALTKPNPAFNWYDENNSLLGRHSNLPGAKVSDCHVKNSILCEGAIVEADEVSGSILGCRALVGKGSIIRDSYIMGNEFYSAPISNYNDIPDKLKIESDCIIRRAIIDRNTHIGKGVQLINKENLTHYNGDNIYIRDGIIVVARGAQIPDHFVL